MKKNKNDQKSSWGGWEESCLISISMKTWKQIYMEHWSIDFFWVHACCLLLAWAALLLPLALHVLQHCFRNLWQRVLCHSMFIVSEICGNEWRFFLIIRLKFFQEWIEAKKPKLCQLCAMNVLVLLSPLSTWWQTQMFWSPILKGFCCSCWEYLVEKLSVFWRKPLLKPFPGWLMVSAKLLHKGCKLASTMSCSSEACARAWKLARWGVSCIFICSQHLPSCV